MPQKITKFNNTTEIIGLDEYVDVLSSNQFDLTDQESLVESAVYLKMLNNNKNFLLEKMWDELEDIDSLQRGNNYASHVFMLHDSKDFFLRANVWRPISKIEKSIADFEYDICHDHNFNILTAGYFGPGYKSRNYEYDYDLIDGLIGEEIAIEDPKFFTLSEGNLALFRAHQDIHVQLPPDSISISLNLIPRTDSFQRAQYQINENTRSIERYLNCTALETIVRLAGSIGDSEFIQDLNRLYSTTSNEHLRAYSMVSSYKLDSSQKKNLLKAIDNYSPVVKQIFFQELEKMNSTV